MSNDFYDPALDPALADLPPEQTINEIPVDGSPVALDLLVQCHACLERGQDTLLRVQWRNDSGVDLGELGAECPHCTALAQAEAPGVRVVVPVVLATGEDADEIDQALQVVDELAAQQGGADDPGALPEIDDSSHPFTGPATAERPAPQPVE